MAGKDMRMEINIDEVLKNIDKITSELLRELDKSLADTVDFIFMRSQEYVPKTTSHLMRAGSLTESAYSVKISFGNYEIHYKAPYAAVVEYGSAGMIAAHGEHSVEHPVTSWEAKRKRGATDQQQMPYLRPAIEEGRKKFPENLKKRLKRLEKT
jgi:hypothetical protein